LVYPAGHECDKCHNTGYKHNDPMHPCKKCWSKYSTPFTGAITYAFSSPSAPEQGRSDSGVVGSKIFQRPLPRFNGPVRPVPPRSSTLYPQPQNLPPPLPPRIQHISSYARPPPNATFLAPGDPRIGGRLCWKCDGTGRKVSWTLDATQCNKCSGSGRVFS